MELVARLGELTRGSPAGLGARVWARDVLGRWRPVVVTLDPARGILIQGRINPAALERAKAEGKAGDPNP